MSEVVSPDIVRVACPHDCPDTCAMLVTVEDGVAKKIHGDPEMPFTEGTLCTKVSYYLERTYSPDRLRTPMKRVGRKGKGEFRPITWDEALDEIAARLKTLAAENPETILPSNYAGTMGMVQYSSMDRRFFHKLGASLLDRTLCSTAGKHGIKATLGGSVGTDPERFDEAQLIILWGANPIVSNLHLWSRVQNAKRRGAKVIAIDPYRSLSAEKCTQHVALLPGTDGALALGMMHVLMRDGLVDRDYVARYTLGYEALEKRVLANIRRSGSRVCADSPRKRWCAGARLRHNQAGRHPPELRHAAPCRWRHRGAHDCLSAGAGRRMARSGGRHRAEHRRLLQV